MNEPSWFWQLFVSKNIIFHNFYVLFPDWYIHETIYYWILINLCLFSDWYIHETSTACNEELRHPRVKRFLIAINPNDFAFFRLLLAIKRDDCSFLRLANNKSRWFTHFFYEQLTPECNSGPTAESVRKS